MTQVSEKKNYEEANNNNQGSIIRKKNYSPPIKNKSVKESIKNLVVNDWFAPYNKKWLAIAVGWILAMSPTTAIDGEMPHYVPTYNENMANKTIDMSYEYVPKDFLIKEYESSKGYYLYNMEEDKIVVNNIESASCEYPDGSKIALVPNPYEENYYVIDWVDKNGKENFYQPSNYSNFKLYDNKTAIWYSDIECTIKSGGVYRVVLPTGEMIEKKFVRRKDGTDPYLYKIVSSYGDEIYYTGQYGGLNNSYRGDGNKVKSVWIENNKVVGIKEYVSEEVIGTYGPHFGTQFGINWYDLNGKLVRTCNLGTNSIGHCVGEIKYLDNGLAECTWNDGTVITYETEENIIKSCTYPNGLRLEIESDYLKMTESNGTTTLRSLPEPLISTDGTNFIAHFNDGRYLIIDGEYKYERYEDMFFFGGK